MHDWRTALRADPVKPLLSSNLPAIKYYTQRDLFDQETESVRSIWSNKETRSLLRRQQDDGSWVYPGKNPDKYPDVNYRLVETYKRLRLLVGKYGFDRSHPAVEKGAEYILSCQTPEGDIRGVYANQYHPHYCGTFLEYIIKAGYHEDPRVNRCMDWLLSVQMEDGGWAPPMLAEGYSWDEVTDLSTTYAPAIPFDTSKPSCNMVTGMTLRALACHPDYKTRKEARRAGELLASRFFKANNYKTYKAADNWIRFQYPFWWNNLLGGLDSLSRLGFSSDQPKVKEALDWFTEHQSEDGLWENSYRKNAKRYDTERAREARLWVTLAVCRVLKRLNGTMVS